MLLIGDEGGVELGKAFINSLEGDCDNREPTTDGLRGRELDNRNDFLDC